MAKSNYFPKTKEAKLQWYETRIHDCMYLLLPESGASIDYAKGALSGLLSGIMACKPGFLPIDLKPFLPHGYRREAIPAPWRIYLCD